MLRRSRVERLTNVQLQQKIIHLEAELSYIHANHGGIIQKYIGQLNNMKENNISLKRDIERLKNENENLIYNIRNYKEVDNLNTEYKHSEERAAFEEELKRLKVEITNLKDEKEDKQKIIQRLHGEIQTRMESFKVLEKEKDIIHKELLKIETENKRKTEEITTRENLLVAELSKMKDEKNQLIKQSQTLQTGNQHLETQLGEKTAELKKLEEEYNKIIQQNQIFEQEKQYLQKLLIVKTSELENLKEEQNKLSQKFQLADKEIEVLSQREMEFEKEKLNLCEKLNSTNIKIKEMHMEIEVLTHNLKLKTEEVDKKEDEKEKMGHELQVLLQNQEQLNSKNVSYQQKITQMESENKDAVESISRFKEEIEAIKEKLKYEEGEKLSLLSQLETREKELARLNEENALYLEEKALILEKLAKVEEENASLNKSFSKISIHRESDDKRMDLISANLNQVFLEMKQLVRMTSSLKHQLEAKEIELHQMKKENGLLMQELVKIQEDYEKSEARKDELENQIDIMRHELHRAQNSLTRLEQFEAEKLKLKEDLETKITEFNTLTDHYKREKDSYLQVLEHVQDQVNVYKEKSDTFDAEKGSWSKQIDELKAELKKTKATVEKMEDLERSNAKLTSELQEKEIEIYKMKKDSEIVLQKQLDQFKVDMKMYQDKISQYEKDREIWEKQMKQMKSQFAALESNLEEKENFIRQYIKQPLSPYTAELQSSTPFTSTTQEQSVQPRENEYNNAQQQTIHPGNWFQKMASQQQGNYPSQNNQRQYQQPIPKQAKQASMDFFTLRQKTTQSSTLGNYGNQWKGD